MSAAALSFLLLAAVPPGADAALRTHVDPRPGTRVAWASADLNGDGRAEAIAYVSGPSICGSGGCTLVVLSPTRNGRWRLAARTTVTRLPVRLLTSRTHGWRDLAVAVGGGGVGPAMAQLRFDGRRYPANPTLAPVTRAVGRTLIAANMTTRPLAR